MSFVLIDTEILFLWQITRYLSKSPVIVFLKLFFTQLLKGWTCFNCDETSSLKSDPVAHSSSSVEFARLPSWKRSLVIGCGDLRNLLLEGNAPYFHVLA